MGGGVFEHRGRFNRQFDPVRTDHLVVPADVDLVLSKLPGTVVPLRRAPKMQAIGDMRLALDGGFETPSMTRQASEPPTL